MRTRIVMLGLVAGALALQACRSYGTEVGIQTAPFTAVRAVDQEVVTAAVDKAFEQLKLPKYEPSGADAQSLTGYVEVRGAGALSEELKGYIAARAAAAASGSGLALREVRRVAERRGNGEWEQLYVDFPDTDVRVLVIVGVAGVDELTEEFELRHTERRGHAVKGRFKATVAVVPRRGQLRPFSEAISGEARYELDELLYDDARR